MTDVSDVSDVSDTPREQIHAPIEPARHLSARELSRETAKLLRAVADDNESFAIRHFGRVVGFLVPLGGRVPKTRRGKLVYEAVPEEPLMDLTEVQHGILRNLAANGPMTDPTAGLDVPPTEVVLTMAVMEFQHGLVKTKAGSWAISDLGMRHVVAAARKT